MSPQRSRAMEPLISLLAVLTCAGAHAQSLDSSIEPGETPRLQIHDAAVLDRQEARDDLACSVTAFKPVLGFDFLFHTGYQVSVPLRELAGTNNKLTILVRVRAERRKDRPVHFVQKFVVPAIEENATGNVVLDGAFRLGEGRYHIDWLIRDANDRVCARFWDLEAKALGKDVPLAQDLDQDVIHPDQTAQFHEESSGHRQQTRGPLKIKVIVNFAPQRLQAVGFGDEELQDLLAILRKIGRDPHIANFSVVACSVRTQQVVYRQQDAPHIDLQALGDTLKALDFGRVDAKQLALKNAKSEFLAQLITEEMRDDRTDGFIFVGPKEPLDADVSQKIIENLKDFGHPVFYMNYSPDRFYYPWRDAFGHVVKRLHGFQYTISLPRDLFNAWSDIVSRMLNAKQPVQAVERAAESLSAGGLDDSLEVPHSSGVSETKGDSRKRRGF